MATVKTTTFAPEYFVCHVNVQAQKDGHSTAKAIGIVLSAKLPHRVRVLRSQRHLFLGQGNHCPRCMTQKEAKYEYPRNDRDCGNRGIRRVRSDLIEIPEKNNSRIQGVGEWQCSCGSMNNRIGLN